MKIADVVSAMGGSHFAEIGFTIAALAFLTVLATTFLRQNRAAFERARHLPLEDDSLRGTWSDASERPGRWRGRPDEPRRGEEAQPPNRVESHSGNLERWPRRGEEAQPPNRVESHSGNLERWFRRGEEAQPPNRADSHSSDLERQSHE